MASTSLTMGSIAAISNGEGDDLQPVLQVVEIRLVNTVKSSVERYRMLLSDGVYHQQGMLATQMNEIVKSGHLQKGSIVRLTEFFCNTIQGRRIIIVMSMQVLVEKSEVIGEPRSYDTSAPVLQKRASDPLQPSVNQSGLSIESVQPHSSSRAGVSVAGQSALVGASLPKQESALNNQLYGSSLAGGSFPGRSISNVNPRAESGSGGFMDSNQNGGAQQQRFFVSTTGSSSPGNIYGRPALPTYQQPPSMYSNRGPIAKNEAPVRVIPISALNPYQGKWTIKARVTTKGDLRHYNNARGEGKVFSFDLLDSDGGEIRATCFNMVADQFYEQIEIGKIYLISKGTLRPAQKNFNHLNNEYEIMLESSTTIQPCLEDNTIPWQQFNFKPVSEIESMDNNSTVDVIGVVSSIQPAGTIMRKNGTETHKRTLQLKDMSGRSVEITLWEKFCNTQGHEIQVMCDSGVFPVLAIKAGRVSDFGGKSVGTISSSQLFINPDIPEMHQLKEWFDREGKNHTALSISRETSTIGRIGVRKNVSQIKDEGLGRSEKPDWITVKATVSFIKLDNFCYTACPLMIGDRQCNKKVNNNGDGMWHCDRCDQSFPECDYRYLLQFQIQDHTGITWVTAFQECAEEILGISAKELYLLKYEEQDELKFAEIVRKVLFNQYLFKLKVKEETFSDEQRLKSTTMKAERVDPSSESRYLLGMIEKLCMEDASIFAAMNGANVSGSGNPSSGYYNAEFRPTLNVPISGCISDRFKMNPSSRVGQLVNQYGGTIDHGTRSREDPSICKNCGLSGHNIQNCPRSVNRLEQTMVGGFSSRSSAAMIDGGNASNFVRRIGESMLSNSCGLKLFHCRCPSTSMESEQAN
ncbi:hypothetical protein HPP92_012596 [Vanilla planifolia]|uniref:Replication protein A subunit n=1 Tax=Vanilla planifolia TaxID=51239 RepID=A0A835R183_VANPL|nr:hypothetical protein HPP92_012596 [Vanilla planifolia]